MLTKKDRYKCTFYCCIFLMLFSIFVPMIMNHKVYMFIDIGADTYAGNWPTLEQAVRWWKGSIKNLWSFEIGLGSSIFISTDTYFDPFIVVLFPFANVADGITLMMIIKYFVLALFSFKFYKKFGLEKNFLVIASLCHTFCGFMVGWGQHYTFSTCFTLFTIILYAVERFRRDRKWGSAVIIIALTSCFSVYFSYIILLFLAFWVMGYYFQDVYNKKNKLSLKGFLKFCLPYAGIVILGIGISMPIFLQQVQLLLDSPRVSNNNSIFNFHLNSITMIITYIIRVFFNVLIGINQTISEQNFYESPILYTSIFNIYGIIAFLGMKLKKRQYKLLIFYIVFALCIVLFPNIVHPIFNGFSDNTTRWLFVLVPIFCIASVRGFEAVWIKKEISEKKVSIIGFLLIELFCLYYYFEILPQFKDNTLTVEIAIVSVSVISFLYSILILLLRKSTNIFLKVLLLGILCLELVINSILCIKDRMLSSSVIDGKEYFSTSNYFDGTREINELLSDKDSKFFRITKTYNKVDLNAPIIQDYYGETYYKSFYSSYMAEFIKEYGLKQAYSNYFYGFDGKEDLRNLFGAKYILTHEDLNYSNYEKIMEYKDINIYLNKDAVGLCAVYDNYMTKREWENLDMSSSISVLYDCCIVEEKERSNVEAADVDRVFDVRDKEIKFSIQKDYENNYILLTIENPVSKSLQIDFQCLTDSPIQIQYSIEEDFPLELSIDVIPNQVDQSWTIPSLNVRQIKISLNGKDNIDKISEIKVYTRKDDEVSRKISELLKNRFDIHLFEEDRIIGEIECEEEKILSFTIPYSNGWKAYIDGIEQDVYPVNIAFLGMNIPEGKHIVELKYFPDELQIGIYCAVVSWGIVVLGIIISHVKKKRLKTGLSLQK